MTFSFPADVERDIELYAKTRRISPNEAALQLVCDGLKTNAKKTSRGELTQAEWGKVEEADPGFAFFRNLPESVLDTIEAASKQARAERLPKRA